MPQFINGSPFSESFNAGLERQQRAATAEEQAAATRFNTDLAMRREAERQEQDEAVRTAVAAPTSPLSTAGTTTPAAPAPAAPPEDVPGAQAVPGGGFAVNGAPVQPAPASAAAAPAATPSPGQAASGLRRRLVSSLSGARGGGAASAQMAFQELEAQQKVIHDTFTMAQQSPELAEQFAAQQGYPIPDSLKTVLRDAASRQKVLQAFDAATKLYPGERQAGVRWQYVKGQLEALRTAGASNVPDPAQMPAPVAPRPDFAPYPITGLDEDGKPVTNVFDPNTAVRDPGNAVTQTGVSGFGKSGGGRAGGGGNMSVFEQKRQAWLSVHPGDAAGANEYAGGRRPMDDTALRLAAERLATNQLKDAFRKPTPEQLKARADLIYSTLKNPSGAAPASPAAAPAPGQRIPSMAPPGASTGGQPTPQTQAEYDALPSGTQYVDPDDGQLYTKP